MPRAAARIFLRVTGVRAERVQDISAVDVRREGVSIPLPTDYAPQMDNNGCYIGNGLSVKRAEIIKKHGKDCMDEYQKLWDSINAKRDGGVYSWEKNPYVWVYEFERMEDYAAD